MKIFDTFLNECCNIRHFLDGEECILASMVPTCSLWHWLLSLEKPLSLGYLAPRTEALTPSFRMKEDIPALEKGHSAPTVTGKPQTP